MLFATEEHLTGGGIGGSLVAVAYGLYHLWRMVRAEKRADAGAQVEVDGKKLVVDEKAVEVDAKRIALEERLAATVAKTYAGLMDALNVAHADEMKSVTDRLTALEKQERACQKTVSELRAENETFRARVNALETQLRAAGLITAPGTGERPALPAPVT